MVYAKIRSDITFLSRLKRDASGGATPALVIILMAGLMAACSATGMDDATSPPTAETYDTQYTSDVASIGERVTVYQTPT